MEELHKIVKNKYKEWNEFLNKYNIYFLDNKTESKNTLDEVKKYIDINHPIPPQNHINTQIKFLGQ
jgi:hypothetical protein